jgi:hypothetical protein
MKFGTFLLALVEPILAKILLSLGFSVVSIVGMEAIVNQIKGTLISNVNSLPADVLQFALFLGVGNALGIIFGAVTTKLLLWAAQNATSIIGKNLG